MNTQPPPLGFEADYRAPCRHGSPDRFFPGRGSVPAAVEAVLAECRTCPFRAPCAAYALEHDVSGIWGATTGADRRRLRMQLGITPVPVQVGSVRPRAVEGHGQGEAACGTTAGYHRHLWADETTCRPCRDAWTAHLRHLRHLRAARRVS